MACSLEEYAKICNIIASCNDIINGKFILAHNKISALLKNLTASKEVYNLLANHLNNFDFEKEFSKAQLTSNAEKANLVLPKDDEKLLPFVFCVLVNINSHSIDLDNFVGEFFCGENNDHAEDFKRFANALIAPFRDLIAKHFEIPVATAKKQPVENKNQEEIMKQAEELEKKAKISETNFEPMHTNETQKEIEEEFDDDQDADEKNYPEMTAERMNKFFDEIQIDCEQILTELEYEKRLKSDAKEDVAYIAETIIFNCQQNDLKNTIALITALDYVVQKSKTLRLYTREMKNVLIGLYEADNEDCDEDE